MVNELSTSHRILSDNGRQFISAEFKHMLSYYRIQQHLTIPYNPQSNSIIERSHRQITEGLRILTNSDYEHGL